MLKSTKALVMLVVLIGVILAVPCLSDTWDAYTDFSSVQSNRGWEYGYSTDTTGNASNTYAYATFSRLTACDVYNGSNVLAWHNNDGAGANPAAIPYPMICQNVGATFYGRADTIPATSMSLLPPKNNQWGILRWTAPAGISGQYTLFAKMGPTGGGATATFSRTISGTTTQLATGVTMPSIALAYGALITPNAGDVYDFAVGKGGTAPTWQYHPFRVTFVDGNWFQTGRVVDANGVGLPGASVTENGYTVYTAADGTFSMVMFPGIHSLTIAKSAYTTSTVTTPNITGVGTNVGTFTLQLTGTWNAKNDFTYVGNPNGQWRYGSYTGKSLTGYSVSPFNQSGLSEWGSYVQYWAYSTVSSTATAPTPCLGNNTRNAVEGVWPALKLAGKPGTTDSTLARWTAPAAGYYNITSTCGAIGATPAIVKTNGSTYTTLASGSGTITLTKYVVNMAQGEFIDFIAQTNSAGNGVVIDATIASGAIGLSGYVQDSNSVKLAGAVVQTPGGAQSATSDSAGNYTLILPTTGTFTINVSKPGYDTVTATETVSSSSLTTRNYTLPVGAVLSGTVTDAASPNPALAGVSIVSGDGLYNVTTNSAGYYSVMVTHGSQAFYYAKSGYIGKAIVLPMAADTVQNLALAQGWDLASNFSAANGNPNPVANAAWSYAYEDTTGGSFTLMTRNTWNPINATDKLWTTNVGSGIEPTQTAFYKNIGQVGGALPAVWPFTLNGGAWREAGSVVASANGYRTIARFTPLVTGNYVVTARWAGVQPSGTTSNVALRRTTGGSSTYLFGDPVASPQQVNGFVGKSTSGYTDSSGTAPVVTFTQTLDIQNGDSIDSIVYQGSTGWTQVDLTISKSGTTIKGQVTSDIPGNPPVINARVQASGGSSSYTAYTDSAGNYSMSVSADAYDIETFKAGYAVGNGSATVAAGSTATANISMHHLGTWDLGQDWTTICNPNGQWSYGSFDQSNNNTFTLLTALHTGEMYSHEPANLTEWTSPQAWIGKNYSTTDPGIGTWFGTNPHFYYVEPGDLFMKTGDRTGVATVRWTAPTTGAYDIYCRVFSQCGAGTTQGFSVLKNGNSVSRQILSGFIGTFAAGYTDTIGPAPAQVFNLTLPLNSGDVVDLTHDFDYQSGHGWNTTYGTNGYPQVYVGITASIARNTTIVTCNNVTDLKNALANQAVGTKVMMMSPLTITSRVDRYKDYSLYLETPDRSQAFKLVGDANTNLVAEGWNITFTGSVITDPADSGRKVLQLLSINDQAAATVLNPLGLSGKAMTLAGPSARDKWVRMWGKVTSLVANTDSATNVQWPYEYYVINDGTGDFKVKMHGQNTWMNDPYPLTAGTIGSYIAVCGIVVKDGTDIVVFPRGYGSGLHDVDDYKQMGNQP